MNALNSNVPQSLGLTELLANDPEYVKAYQLLVLQVVNLTAGELQQEYPREYDSWRNRKKYSKDNKIPWFKGMDAFAVFLSVNGPIPHKGWTLDRIDPIGGYLPENLRWASKATQSQNRTNAVRLNINGESLTLNQVASKFGKTYDSVRMGFKRHGSPYLATLKDASKTVDEIFLEVEQWTYPENCQEVAVLYPRRREKYMRKPRFFVELVAFEIKARQDFLKSSNPSVGGKQEAEADIVALTPLLNETQAYIDGINRRLYLRQCEEKSPNSNACIQAPPAPDWDPDYYDTLNSDGCHCPWATYPKNIDPVIRISGYSLGIK